MKHEIVVPILNILGMKKYMIFYGYRSTDYFEYPFEDFVLINIGMFASLSSKVTTGKIFIPEVSYCVEVVDDKLVLTNRITHRRLARL